MIKTTKTKKSDRVKVTFALPDNGPASVVGDFNEWDPFAHPLRKRSNGTRSVAIELPTDEPVRFRYLADGGVWLDEPEAEIVTNDDGTRASVLSL